MSTDQPADCASTAPPQETSEKTLDHDLLPALQVAETRCRRWRSRTLILGGVVLLLLPTALVQAFGTFTALRISREARQQAAGINEETAKQHLAFEASQQRLRAAELLVQEAMLRADQTRRNAEREVAAALHRARHLDATLATLDEQITQQQNLLKAIELQRREIEQELRFLKDLEAEDLARAFPGHQADKACPAGLPK